jgi:ABC-type nitrate/sulfonate/bicarbonate transport system substrate-binding protein
MRRLAAAMAVMTIVAACSSGGTGGTTATTTAPAATVAAASPSATAPGKPEVTSLKVAHSGSEDFDTTNKRYFIQKLQAMGITVEYSNLATADTALRTLVSGGADLYIGSLGTVARFTQAAGGGVKVIANDIKATDYLLMSQKTIPDVQGLAGKTVGINSPGDAGDTAARACLQSANFDLTKATFVQIGGTSARVAALVAAKIDAAPAHTAESLTALAKVNTLKVLVNCAEAIGPMLTAGLTASDAWLSKNPNLAQIVVDTFVDSSRWAASKKDEFVTLSKTVTPDLADDIRGQTWDIFAKDGYYAKNGGMSDALLTNWDKLAVLTREVTTGTVPDHKLWIDDKYVKSYLARNGSQPE